LTVVGISRVNAISNALTTIGDVNSVKQRYAINFRGSVHDCAISLRDVTLVQNDSELKAALADIARLADDYSRSAVLLDKMFSERKDITDQERAILASIKQTEARTMFMIERVSELRLAGDLDQAKEVMLRDARPAFIEWLARINQFIDLQEKMNQVESAHATSVASGFQTLMITLAALVIGVIVPALIIRSLYRVLGGEPSEASSIAKSIAAGDLAVSIPTAHDDQSSVIFAMKEMRDSLVKIVSDVRTGTDMISSASAQIAAGNQDLSNRTEQQATSLEETTSSMEQLTSTVRQNVDNARQANQLAVSASDVAVKWYHKWLTPWARSMIRRVKWSTSLA
jgi:methyl-accepting chemotaxis protein